MTDVVIIGGGPAGVSAALTAMHRGKTALIVSSPPEDSPLWKAEHIDNYPGLPGVTGRELLQKLLLHAEGSGAQLMRGRVLSILPMGRSFGVSVGSDFVQGRAVVIYPEAHLWPMYTGIRNFKSDSFLYPLMYGAPVFCTTTVLKKRRVRKQPKVIIYVDGAFLPDPALSTAENKQKLRDEVHAVMCERAKESDYDRVKYIKAEPSPAAEEETDEKVSEIA